MKKVFTFIFALLTIGTAYAGNKLLVVKNYSYQTVTGFGAACCDGAMRPYGTDVQPVRLLYGSQSKIGLNIMRMEISPNFKGDINTSDIGWNTPYDWEGSVPSAKQVKSRGGIVFGTPWSPPGDYKTNGGANGGHVNDKDDNDPANQRGELRTDCYEKFFPWINTFLAYMKSRKVDVDAVSVQNEPDWWVNYSGCLYTPAQQLTLVKNYAHLLDRETYKGVRLISAEPLGFDPRYSDALMDDEVARDQIDIIAGHLYGHPPLGNMKAAAVKAAKYGKEVWMTEHSVSDYLKDRLPNWDEQLEFARELNECMLAGCTGYIYWYMRAHWAFVGTGEEQYGAANGKNKLLPRAYVMSHFAKNVTGSTRLEARGSFTTTTGSELQASAYIKGDSLIIMAINSSAEDHTLKLTLPYYVKSGTHLKSTGNEAENLCQTQELDIAASIMNPAVSMPARSVNTYVFMIDQETTAITDQPAVEDNAPATYYDLQGRKLSKPKGVCVERTADGFSRKVYMND